ncbi:hypothetical protein OHA21_19800 [Actinoplanes sp. NBC_00393]|uniref:alpha/beta hydrolase family protein n=1 Tax=Actinoplanes sp. NBC_00393 TaxID=2975953 RepID=UPI002E1E444B
MTTALPQPAGPYAVGRIVRDWTDRSRTDRYAPDPAPPRSLVTWIWYPAQPQAGPPADYLPGAWQATAGTIGIDANGLTANSVDGAPLSEDRAAYPVVLLSPSGFPPLMLSGTAEELASRGFVVVGVNHTYETTVTVFPDGRTVPGNPAAIAGALGPQSGEHRTVFDQRAGVCRYKAEDLAFLADQLFLGRLFPGRLDLDRLTAAGHSFGGAAALQWCHDDPRCKAAVNLDGALWSEVGRLGLPRPVLQLLAPHPEFDMKPEDAVAAGIAPDPDWYAEEKAITLDGWTTVGNAVRIAGATHLSFMDVAFLPARPDSLVAPMLARTTIEPARMLTVANAVLVAFLTGADMSAALAAPEVAAR